MTILKATAEAWALMRELREEYGVLSFHVSGSYGISVVCLPARELSIGELDVRVGDFEGAPLYFLLSEIDNWRDSTALLGVAKGVAAGFSLEGPKGVHFTLRKEIAETVEPPRASPC